MTQPTSAAQKVEVTHVEYDGKFQVEYTLSDGTESAIRVFPAFGRLIEDAWLARATATSEDV